MNAKEYTIDELGFFALVLFREGQSICQITEQLGTRYGLTSSAVEEMVRKRMKKEFHDVAREQDRLAYEIYDLKHDLSVKEESEV